MPLTSFKVLSFGCYGTLIDRDSGVFAALRPLRISSQLKLTRTRVLEAFDRHEATLLAEAPDLPCSEILEQAHLRLAREWGVLCSEADHALFRRSVTDWLPFVDAPAGLQYLKRYFKLVVLSNGDREGLAASSSRLEARFDAVYTADKIGSVKPDPRNFEYLIGHLAKLGFTHGDILHTAHSLTRDHAPATKCGLASAWIDRRGDENATVEPAHGSLYLMRFSNIADMVRAHQEELRNSQSPRRPSGRG